MKDILLIIFGIAIVVLISVSYCNAPAPDTSDIDSTLYVNKHRFEQIKKEYASRVQEYESKIALLNTSLDSIKGLKDSVKVVYRDRTVFVDNFTGVQQDSFITERYGGNTVEPHIIIDTIVASHIIKDVIRKDELEELAALDKAEIDHLEYLNTEKDSIISFQDQTNAQLSQLAEDNQAAAETLKEELEKKDKKLGRAKTLNVILGVAAATLGGVVFMLSQ